MDLIKEYIDKVKGVEVNKENVKEVRSLVDETKTKMGEGIDSLLSNSKSAKEGELRSALDTAYELRELVGALEEKLVQLEEQLAEEEGKEVEEEVKQEIEDEVGAEKGTEERSAKNKNERGGKKMAVEKLRDVKGSKYEEERNAYGKYLQTRSITEGLTLEDEEVVVPEDKKTDVDIKAEKGLIEAVSVVPVTAPIGTHTAVTSGNKVMSTVEELVESPKLGLFEVTSYDWKIKTRRAYAPISFEAIEDVDHIISTANAIAVKAGTDTKNAEIVKALEAADIREVDINDIADFVGLEVDTVNDEEHVGFGMSRTQYNRIARLRDNEGRYYLHNNLTEKVGKEFIGYPVKIYKDSEVGADFFYFGDFKAAIILFDRMKLTVTWDSWMNYGKCFSPIVRFDVIVAEPQALVKLNVILDEADEPAGIEG